MSHTFTCAHCGEMFESGRPDQEAAHAEAVTLWGRRGDAPGMAEICDDCFQEIMGWFAGNRDRLPPDPDRPM